jgi:hypothetical protein
MTLRILRAITSVVAAATGLLLAYGLIYAMEGMTTRVPVSQLHELGISTLWMVPWTIISPALWLRRQRALSNYFVSQELMFFFTGLGSSSQCSKLACGDAAIRL